ncbi:hypothetical protein L873DRAFT_283884 [Choiromyces venosus 120613-1]|uniref:Structure-specific endonuclease subunit SLX4 n=1 Tax=Choiromyces venosus 120613-1 TaxID=1336337 RepID=A0A3N4JXS4_9PEZI|nr:hypothetical protein L873DRAFT_283884 [Choiromyces venosus 120613-1]
MAPLKTTTDPIILLSSPPVPSLRITTTNANTTISSPLSSPLLSPSALLQELVEKGKATIGKQKDTKTPPRQVTLGGIWSVPSESEDLAGVVTKPPPKRKRTTKPTGDPIVKNSRAKRDSISPTLTDVLLKSKALDQVGAKDPNKPKTKTTRKKGAGKDGHIVAKSSKRSMPTKSRFFGQPDTAEASSKPLAYEKPALIPKSPNKLLSEPPIHPARRQWTPVKDTVISIDSSPITDDLETGEEKDTKYRRLPDFASMVGEMKLSTSYGREGSAVPLFGGLDKPGNVLIKKRAIEMVNLPNSSTLAGHKPKAPKLKQPKKKQKTITGQATAQYREAKEAASHSLLEYFTPEDPSAESAAAEKPTRKRKTASEKNKDSIPAPVLLSPKAAKRQFDETECIFGTSSQLEVMAEIEIVNSPEPAEDENAPDYLPPSTSIVRRSFLKTLTKDRKGGNKLVGTRRGANIDLLDVSIVEDFEAPSHEFPVEPKLPESRLGRGTTRKLWDAAARDLNGGLLSVEVIDMSLGNDIPSLPSSPRPIEEISAAGNPDLLEDPALSEPGEVIEDEPIPNLRIEDQSMGTPLGKVVQGEDIPNLRIEGQPANVSQENGVEEEFIPNLRIEDMPAPVKMTRVAMSDADEPNDLTFGDLAKTLDRASSIIPNSATISCVGVTANIATTLVDSSAATSGPGPRVQFVTSMPDYNAWITTKLKAEVAKYGFKDLKTRPRMISILEQCWQAKNKRNIEHDGNKCMGVTISNTFTQRTRSTSPSLSYHAPSGGPYNPPSRGYSTTTAPGVSKFRENGPTIRRCPTRRPSPIRTRCPSGTEIFKSPDRGRSPTPRDQPTTSPPVAGQPAASKAPRSSLEHPPRPLSPSKPAQSIPLRSPKRKAKKHKHKQKHHSPSSPRSLSKSLSLSRSRSCSRSRSPTKTPKMISCIILGVKPGSEGFKFSQAILMYDPISVEELMEWLNTRGIREGGYGKEAVVSTGEVKDWCISNGICCVLEDAGWRAQRAQKKS